ncbi:MAG: dihydrolipoamide acetyltransferase family protein [Candidatus Promineifilaceae bacterium]|nr:dihydrolipoamide acetyltransferase family protein [Candidatus Promineifilaceae bacterium]
MATQVIMPEMGEGVIEGTVARWLKEEGERIEEFEPLLEIETDKVTTEATAEVAGTLIKIYVEEGETVPVGTVLAAIGEPDESVPEEPAAFGEEPAEEEEEGAVTLEEAGAPEEAAVAERAEAAQQKPAAGRRNGGPGGDGQERDEELPFADWASPVVKRIAQEHDVDLSQVPGTGRGGRTTKKDILAYLEKLEEKEVEKEPAAAPAAPEPAVRRAPRPEAAPERARKAPAPRAPEAAPGDVIPVTGMRRSIADHMVRSKKTSPHVTTVFEIDFTNVINHRSEQRKKLTFTPYIVAATAQALREHPIINSSWTEDGIVLKERVNIGVAVALEDGLIVPVVKDADHYSLRGLAGQLDDLVGRARRDELKPGEVQGGTFSITNHGVSGSLFAMPIINQPQAAIMGVGKIEKRIKIIDDAIAIRPLAYVTLTFDHRILDGATGDFFMQTFKEIIENWE